MLAAIASVLQLIVDPCYALTGNWWLSILLFTLITKVILIPMSLWVQWNSIVMVRLMPELNRLKVKYFGDRETIGEKQNELYKEKHYHPLLSLVPLAVQILILFGLVDVIHSITDSGTSGTEFLGLVPIEDGGLSWVMPVLAGLSAVALGWAQNRINPLQREQSRAEKNLTNGLSIGLSLVLGVFVAAGMAFYWICSNLSAILVQLLMNVMMKPQKYIDYDDLAASRAELDELESLEGDRKRKWYQRDPLAKRERADYKRFFNVVGKHIVFYSEGSGFYKYFKGAIEWLLAHSDCVVHYVTNDPYDQVFGIAEGQPRIRPYYIGPKRAITLMMKMDADVVVATLEDLENFYIKRSYVRRDIEYVFMFHHMMSCHLTPTKQAYNHYDTLLCVGPHQVAELRRAEELYGLPAKNLIEAGYDLIDEEIAAFEAMEDASGESLAGETTVHSPKPVISSGARNLQRPESGGSPDLRSQNGGTGIARHLSRETRLYPESRRDALLRARPTGGGGRAEVRPDDNGWAKTRLPRETRLNPPFSVAARSCASSCPDARRAGARRYGGERIKTRFPRRPVVLVAPSWQEGNVLDSCADELLGSLLDRGWRVIVRPHPEYTKRYRARWEALQGKWADRPADELYFERDFSSNETIWTSDILITDWSSVACEFAFSTCKPCIFVDTPMKVGNPDWEELGIVPTDISLRNEVGVSFPPERVAEIGEAVAGMLAHADDWHDKIARVRDGFIFHVGRGAEVSGEYLLEAMLRAQSARKR